MAAFGALAEEDQGGEEDACEDDEDAGYFQKLGEAFDEGVDLGHGLLATGGGVGCSGWGVGCVF